MVIPLSLSRSLESITRSATQTAVSKTDLTSKPLPQHTDEIKPEVPQENIEPGKDFTPIDYSDIDKAYEQTFIDYQNDLAAIKNKTPIDNPRLIKMQEDFQNIEALRIGDN